MTERAMEEFSIFLTGRGLRLTEQRRRIADVFFAGREHLTADEIYRQVKRSAPGIGHATVYRTIRLLEEAGLASGMTRGDGRLRYEPPSVGGGHHDHLICRRCGLIVEFEEEKIEVLQERVAQRHGFTVTGHRMELYGICRSCGRRGHPAPAAAAGR